MTPRPRRRPQGKGRTKKLRAESGALAVHAQVAALLLRYPNVLTVGVGAPERKGKPGDTAAIVVGVRKKRDMRAHATIPKEIMGVRVDVKEVPPARLTSGPELRSGMQCWGAGRQEFGHLGVLGQLPGGGYAALTTLHVLVDEQMGTDVDGGDFQGSSIEAAMPGQSGRIGALERGGFGASEDVGLVRLDAGISPSPLLASSNILIGTPAPISSVNTAVQLMAPDGPFDGQLEESSVHGLFETAAGPQIFSGLAKFSIDVSVIRLGWCGSPICTRVRRDPLALLSFASASGQAFAYGFPLAPHWQAWALEEVEEDGQ